MVCLVGFTDPLNGDIFSWSRSPGGVVGLVPVVLGFHGVYSLVCDGEGCPVFAVESGVEFDESSGLEFGACFLDLSWFVVD